ncbi:hypothetical protein LIP24_09525 [Collinsella aerofaciens]|uniref:hypothetical protein n=1 Tax=Collinsella aerofaciens TaxID=74426 RepID=UPI001D026CCC|nr:hypothetical protein [Collinsella aerofaciens]MCB5366877.1 hypothetical protein [Collinsella aerofaciens]
MNAVSNYTETLEKTVRDLLERQEDLIRTAFTDQLTGLGNRGGFARSLEELWEQDAPVTMFAIASNERLHCARRYIIF